MTWNATVHYTQVDSDTVVVRHAAPWFGWTCSAAWTLPAVLLLAAPEPARTAARLSASSRRPQSLQFGAANRCGDFGWRKNRGRGLASSLWKMW
jgi:hypothetical protein